MKEINNDIKINNLNFERIPKEDNANFDDTLSQLKDNMLKRCEYEIPEYGNFSKVKETINNNDKNVYAGEVSLICEASEDDPKKRYLSYNHMNPENRKGISCLIGTGTKEDIMELLKDDDFITNLKQDSERIAEKMKFMKW